MSFANKGRDSKPTKALRKEYEDVARRAREAGDPASAAKLRDEKNKAFERVKEQITAERREELAGLHKVLIKQGKLKTDEQVKQERAAAEAGIPTDNRQ